MARAASARPEAKDSPRERSKREPAKSRRERESAKRAKASRTGELPAAPAPRRLPLYREARDARRASLTRSEPTCSACGLCCTYVAIEVDAPDTVKRATQLLFYVYHEGVSLYANDDEWMVQFESTCRYLQPDYRCGVYATRPHICREFSEQSCEVNTGDDGKTFYTGEQFMDHMKLTRPRLYRKLLKDFAPPPESGRPGLTPFQRRVRAVHARRAAVGIAAPSTA